MVRVFFVVCFFEYVFSFFAVRAGATPLPKQQNMKHVPARTAKNTHYPPRPNSKKKNDLPFPHRSTPKLDFQQNVRALQGLFVFGCLDGGRVLFFAIWAGGVFFFCCSGGGRVSFLLFGRGREFTHLQARLAGL